MSRTRWLPYLVLSWTACGEVQTVVDASATGQEAVIVDDGPATDGTLEDGTVLDATCSHTCQAPNANNQPQVGQTTCRPMAMPNTCTEKFTNLENVELCGCSAGTPAMFVKRVSATTVNLAFVSAPIGNTGSISIQIEGLGCFSMNVGTCDVMCPSGQIVYGHPDVGPLQAGTTRGAVMHSNDECSAPISQFTLVL